MTEFDFDELDRSIARAMAQDSSAPKSDASGASVQNGSGDTDVIENQSQGAEAPRAPEPAASGSTAPAAVSPVAGSTPPVSAAPSVVAAPAPAPAPAPKPPAAKHRGQFMDVVHPSSDMTKPVSARPGKHSLLASSVNLANTQPEFDDDYEEPADLSMRSEEVDSISVTPTSPFLSEVKPEKRPLDALQAEQKMALSNRMNVIKPLNDNIEPIEENRDRAMPNASDIKKAESRAADVFAAEMASLEAPEGGSVENSVVPDDALRDEPENSENSIEIKPNLAHDEKPLDLDQKPPKIEEPRAADEPDELDALADLDELIRDNNADADADADAENSAENSLNIDFEDSQDREVDEAVQPEETQIESAPENHENSQNLEIAQESKDDKNTAEVSEVETLEPEAPQQTPEEQKTPTAKKSAEPAELSIDQIESEEVASQFGDVDEMIPPEEKIESQPARSVKQEVRRTTQTSIPQQYREEEDDDEPESGAIYDTSEYHTALAKAKKPKKSHAGLKWFFTIVFLLALGAMSGAVVYYFSR